MNAVIAEGRKRRRFLLRKAAVVFVEKALELRARRGEILRQPGVVALDATFGPVPVDRILKRAKAGDQRLVDAGFADLRHHLDAVTGRRRNVDGIGTQTADLGDLRREVLVAGAERFERDDLIPDGAGKLFANLRIAGLRILRLVVDHGQTLDIEFGRDLLHQDRNRQRGYRIDAVGVRIPLLYGCTGAVAN